MTRPNQEKLKQFLQQLQKTIIEEFEKLEPLHKFTFKPWNYHQGNGGGTMAHLRGEIFEKAAVNFSAINGNSLPFNESSGPFFATGVSLITHMMNPHAPTVHMNVRYIEAADKFWFGGGYDLTPMGFFYDEDKVHFHKTAQEALDAVDPSLYPEFYKQAQSYFFIPHRQKERGVGGIFFDHYNTDNLEKDLNVWQAVANSFLKGIMPIYHNRIHIPYSSVDKEKQNASRAHYVEFNLLYDRGTKFGFQSGGNPEAILSSMPPTATW